MSSHRISCKFQETSYKKRQRQINHRDTEKLREEKSPKTPRKETKFAKFEREGPALQVEQVKMGHFEAIYEDNVWKLKPSSNDQKAEFGVEYLFGIVGGASLGPTVFYCGDDVTAKQVIKSLIEQAGFEAVDAGKLE